MEVARDKDKVLTIISVTPLPPSSVPDSFSHYHLPCRLLRETSILKEYSAEGESQTQKRITYHTVLLSALFLSHQEAQTEGALKIHPQEIASQTNTQSKDIPFIEQGSAQGPQ